MLSQRNTHFTKLRWNFLGFIATTEGLKIDPKKVEAIMSWKVSKIVRDMQCFLRFANFC